MEKDGILWQKFKEGDRAVFELIIRDHYRILFDYGKKFLQDQDNLNDCIHELFTSLWERRYYLGSTDRIKPYLLKSLRHLIIKEIQRVNLFTSIDEEESYFMSADHIEALIISRERNDEMVKQVLQILNTLTPRQKEIIYLKFYENLTNDQIATVLGISRPAVANLVHISLKLFREKWESFLYLLLYFSY